MIKNLDQANKVQQRRIDSENRGYAKAVRRFVQRNHNNDYRNIMAGLPAYWGPKREVKPDEVFDMWALPGL